MCGIAGIIGRIDEANAAALDRMSAALQHRGPDGAGTWTSTADARGWGLQLAHRRLAVIDPTPRAAQPLVDGVVVAFNGEIYNHRELGPAADGEGDTAALARVLRRGGERALSELRGMFALACWDPGTRTLLLARDPLGIKPLYFARNDDPGAAWTFAFASEVRALVASGLLARTRLEPRAVAAMVWNGFLISPETAVDGVRLLPSGRWMRLDGQGKLLGERDFWRVSAGPRPADATEADVKSALETSVSLHLTSDVPLAVCLSGGVDSTAIASLAQRAHRGGSGGTAVHTFTLGVDDPALDERAHAARVAAALGTQHHQATLTEADFVRDLDRALDSLDQPTFDGINAYYLARAVRDAGFTVALTGIGGDELFGGYRAFADVARLWRWSRRLPLVPRDLLGLGAHALLRPLARGAGAVPRQTRWAKLPDLLAKNDDLTALYQLGYALFRPGFQRELLAPGLAATMIDGLTPDLRKRLDEELADRSALSSLSVLETRIYLGERLLRDVDAASMASSVELRVPLVDPGVYDVVDRLPDRARFEPLGQKAMLRRVGLAGLDPGLFAGPKRGFELPLERWIRGGLASTIDATLRDPALVAPVGLDPDAVARVWRAFVDGAPGLTWSRVWALYVLVRWCHRHRVFR